MTGNYWTTLLKEEKKPKCFGNFPFCPHNKTNIPFDPLNFRDEVTNLGSLPCKIWRLCKNEYLNRFFDNPSFKHGKVCDLE